MRRNCKIAAAGLLLALLCAACEQARDPAVPEPPGLPVVVYVAYADDALLRQQLERYSEDTGVVVTVRRGNAADIVGDVIANKVAPPADILITRSVSDVWRAAEEGALRPIAAERPVARTPAWSRDPDGLWAGTGLVMAAIASGDGSNVGEATTFAALAEPRFAGELCLSSSAGQVSQAVIATLIDELGVRPAELVVRGWLKNLAMPVFHSEDELLAALLAGTCNIGIAAAGAAAESGLSMHVPQPAAVDVAGIGIGRHANNPAGAQALLKWLFAEYPDENFDLIDAQQKNVSLVAWYQRDVVLLAERARYF